MKELNLEVGQKVWSIQLGDCYVDSIDYNLRFPVCFRTKDGRTCTYTSLGQATTTDLHSSVFESNPFEQKLVQENEPKENKAELILALFEIVKPSWESTKSFKEIAENKLIKLLESL